MSNGFKKVLVSATLALFITACASDVLGWAFIWAAGGMAMGVAGDTQR